MDQEFLELLEKLECLDGESAIPDFLWQTVTDKITDYLQSEQSYGEDRPARKEDFEEHTVKSEIGLKCLLLFLQKMNRFPHALLNKEFVVRSVLLCGEHSSSNLWTTPESIKISTDCLEIIVSRHKYQSISELLVSGTIAQQLTNCLLLSLRPKLLKDTWRKYPAAVHCYQWLLLQLKCPYLSDYLNAVLPTALIILDDHVPSRRQIGLTCITHIIQNVPRTELCSQGLDSVLYHTLRPLLLQREPQLVELVYACMASLLAHVEQGYTKSVAQGEWSRLESTLLSLLRNMEVEDRLVLRLAYVKSLQPVLKAMGPSVIQLSQKLLSVFQEYLDKQTPDARHYALLAFEIYIFNSKERLPSNGDKIFYLLLRTLYDLTKEMSCCEVCGKSTYATIEIFHSNCAKKCSEHWDDLEVVIRCIQFMKNTTPSQFDLVRQDVKETVNFNPVLTEILKYLF